MNMYIRGKEDGAMGYLDESTAVYEEFGHIGEIPVATGAALDEVAAIPVGDVAIGRIVSAALERGEIPPNATIHKLKCDPDCYAALRNGLKKAEVRFDDRGFKSGDVILMQETGYSSRQMKIEDKPLSFTGNECYYRITHIQRGYGLPTDMVVMSLAEVWL